MLGGNRLAFARNQALIGVWNFQGFAAVIGTRKNGKHRLPTKNNRNPTGQGGYLSANGNWLVCINGDQVPGSEARVEIWDTAESKSIGTFKPMQNWGVQVALSADGKTLATWGQYLDRNPGNSTQKSPNPNQVIQIWNVAKQKEQVLVEVKRGAAKAALSSDGKFLVVSSGGGAGEVELFDAVTGKPVEQFAGRSGSVAALSFSPNGKWVVALMTEDGAVQVWDIAGKGRVCLVESPIQAVNGIVFPADDRAIAWGMKGQAIALWEVPSGKCLTPLDLHTGAITSITFLKDGQTFVSAGEDARWIEWDRARGSVVRSATIRFPERATNRPFGPMTGSIAVSPDGAHVVGWPSPGTFYQYSPAIVFDRLTGKETLAIEMSGDRMNRTYGAKPIFSSEGTRLIAPPSLMNNATEDQRVRIWDVKRAAKTAEITLRAGNSTAAFTPDDSRLVTATIALGAPPMPGAGVNASADLVIVGWDLKTGKKLGEFTISNWGSDPRLGRRNSEIHIAAVNNSSAVLTSGTRIWGVDFEAGRDGFEIDSFPNTQFLPCTITVSKDGKLIAAGVPLEGEDKYGVRIYDAVRGTKLHTFTGHSGPMSRR